jgi:hypothetical protein
LTGGNSNSLYRGRSMLGTFRFGDSLIIESVPFNDLRPGDIVVYKGLNHGGDEDNLVHRVISIRPEGLVTQGDNNSRPDKTFVNEGKLLGRVCHMERGGKKIPVCNGRMGLLRVRVRRRLDFLQNEIWRLVRSMGRGTYGRIRESGLIPLLWRPAISKVFLMTEKGPMVKYISRNRTVGEYWPENGRFRCRKPYDLLLWDKVPKK